jgi:hypothetical protein
MAERMLRDGEKITVPFVAKVKGDSFELVPEGISSGLHWTLNQNEVKELRNISYGASSAGTTETTRQR